MKKEAYRAYAEEEANLNVEVSWPKWCSGVLLAPHASA